MPNSSKQPETNIPSDSISKAANAKVNSSGDGGVSADKDKMVTAKVPAIKQEHITRNVKDAGEDGKSQQEPDALMKKGK